MTVRLDDETLGADGQPSVSGSSLESVKSADHGTLDADSGSTPRRSGAWTEGPWKLYSGLQSESHDHAATLSNAALVEVKPQRSTEYISHGGGPRARTKSPLQPGSPTRALPRRGGGEDGGAGSVPSGPPTALQVMEAVRADSSEAAPSQLQATTSGVVCSSPAGALACTGQPASSCLQACALRKREAPFEHAKCGQKCTLLQGEDDEPFTHAHVIDTMRVHHQVVLDQAEMHGKEALMELRGKTDELSGLRARVDGDLAEVCLDRGMPRPGHVATFAQT